MRGYKKEKKWPALALVDERRGQGCQSSMKYFGNASLQTFQLTQSTETQDFPLHSCYTPFLVQRKFAKFFSPGKFMACKLNSTLKRLKSNYFNLLSNWSDPYSIIFSQDMLKLSNWHQIKYLTSEAAPLILCGHVKAFWVQSFATFNQHGCLSCRAQKLGRFGGQQHNPWDILNAICIFSLTH